MGGLYVDEFKRWTPFWGGCMLMNSRCGPPFFWGGGGFMLLNFRVTFFGDLRQSEKLPEIRLPLVFFEFVTQNMIYIIFKNKLRIPFQYLGKIKLHIFRIIISKIVHCVQAGPGTRKPLGRSSLNLHLTNSAPPHSGSKLIKPATK